MTKIALASLLIVGGATIAFGQGAALKETYTIRVKATSLAPTEFVLKINGEVVGSYDDDAQVDVTDRMKPGKNTVAVAWKALAPIKNPFAKSILTLGVGRGGKWSTAFTATSSKAMSRGTRTVTLTAR